jgi:hypothetical protein
MVTTVAGGLYRVVILTADRQPDADALELSLRSHAMVVGNGRVSLEIQRGLAASASLHDPDGPPTVAVVLSGGSVTAKDVAIAEAVDACQRALVPVLPVCTQLRRYQEQVPPSLWPVNGKAWSKGASPDALAALVLQLVGLADEDRRIFLSHRRFDGSVLAEQLRTALGDDRWDVFLDRFSVPPAVDFQKRLDRELADKAFVLLLETPQASGSDWVEHEVAFALRHRLGLLSLAFPETTRAQLFPSVHDSWRQRLAPSDFVAGARAGALTQAALERVLVDVELGHARATRLRRESVMTDAEAELLSLGYDVRPVAEWALLGTRGGRQELVLATPRAPVAADLREAEMQRRLHRRSGVPTRAWLVHPTEDVDESRASLLLWLTERRKVAPTPLMLLRSRLSA